MSDTAPQPDEKLADLTDEEQVALLESNGDDGQTDNRLSDEDAEVEQPPQDPNFFPEGTA